MNLRPKLAQEFAEAFRADIEEHGIGPESTDQWAILILERFTSHSIPIERNDEDPQIVEPFLNKYPECRGVIDTVKAEARKRFPDVEFSPLRLVSDPESCHICWEGQHVSLDIYCGLESDWEDGSPFIEAWGEFYKWSPDYDDLVHARFYPGSLNDEDPSE